MSLLDSFCSSLCVKERKDRYSLAFMRQQQVTPAFIRRLGLEVELTGHSGCVNCLEWNESGTRLASGSDDVKLIIWDPFLRRNCHTVDTGHTGNIFSVKFLPNTNDAILASAAADCKIRVHDLVAGECSHVFSCHAGRVKRLATSPGVPFLFWSASEDGTIMQFDLRCPESSSSSRPKNVLINLNAHLGSHAEAKCVAVNPLRTEQLAVGANDPYVRLYDRRKLSLREIRFPTPSEARTPNERDKLLKDMTSEELFAIPADAAQYYVAGHLPQKLTDYKKRFRSLACTFLTFSPDGSELLVNLGGEQIYLFDINSTRRPKKFDIPPLRHNVRLVAEPVQNGHRVGSNGHVSNGHVVSDVTNGHVLRSATQTECPTAMRKPKKVSKNITNYIDRIRKHANGLFEKEQYDKAIRLYNKAIALSPTCALLYGNRAAAYMKRRWDGDLYAALRDCHSAIELDPTHLKAHFRLAKCLLELSWTKDALDCLQHFKGLFPDHAQNSACETLEKDIRAVIFSKTDEFKAMEKQTEEQEKMDEAKHRRRRRSLSEIEQHFRARAVDYTSWYCGHCNTTTDIKEANYFGSNSQYIVAGSDDGSFYVWEKSTANIVKVLRGDDSIVNCLQPHPTSCLLATSGIDPVVRLWSPRPEDGSIEERQIENSDDAASANQRRMNADPLEVMLMNMGYRITGLADREGGDGDSEREVPVPSCRTS